MDIYREVILDHYKNPRNFGHLEKPDAKIEEGNVTCGDRIVMEINVRNNGTIEDIRFSGEGCAISQAAASMLTEKVAGKKLSQIMKLSTGEMVSMLGTTLTPSRIKCATLPLEVLQKAVLTLK
ncbi:SUF system NifU family Fe-S cluster assembly protein [Candidatus Gottesmanbacteria bacterium RIFCSPLOWO2_01_FULL_46_9]|uniref:SUF system NifU family Fe-S cluster assembly protein n=1 Tax=Candidatus Gottesmanbacteria bacterium RIFCSPLOWO2_01_FULL_46_9 TaxID=1798394 RepID=A0A1F6AXD9_9BACT|nr:MAG: SUF system NifU family Fe-S cluster assembly protein [Candidatus Gottesmanbacteria bacterium RIFCSPLOWO2_01_FULL_46_9]